MSNERDELARLTKWAKELADPDWCLSVPSQAKQVITQLLAALEPRTITTRDELEALRKDSIIRDIRFGQVFERTNDGEVEGEDWEHGGEIYTPDHVDLPATVLWEPTS